MPNYAPPAHNAVNFNFSFGSYSAPNHASVKLNFGPPLYVVLQNATVSASGSESGWFSTLQNATASIAAYESGTFAPQLANATASISGTSTPITSRKRRRIQICA
jgi:hypothetical protein